MILGRLASECTESHPRSGFPAVLWISVGVGGGEAGREEEEEEDGINHTGTLMLAL